MRYFIEISYRGTNYCGWQKQNNARTVQEEIEKAISTILKTDIKITASGRTDAGVHASQQFAHFDTTSVIDSENLSYRLNAFLSRDIAIRNIFKVKKDAHARFDAQERSYEYHVHTKKNPFQNGVSNFYKTNVDIETMNKACSYLLGKQDFECFSKVKTDVNNFFCDIKSCKWEQEGDLYVFKITANRFLRNMVRAIVGTLLEIGENKYKPENIVEIIKSRSRQNAGRSVSAEGLFLCKVVYPNNIFE